MMAIPTVNASDDTAKAVSDLLSDNTKKETAIAYCKALLANMNNGLYDKWLH